MEQTNKLMHDISTAEANTTQLESNVKTINNNLDNIHQNLGASKKVNQSLKDLNSSLSTAEELLTIVSIIPEIGTEASELKKSIIEFQKPIKTALESSNKIEKIVVPIRNTIEKMEPKVKKADSVLLSVMNLENQFVDSIGKATHCINSLPDSTIKSNLVDEIDKLSKTIDPQVLQFDKAQLSILTGIKTANSKCEEIKNWAASLVKLSNEINAVINVLKPLISSLKAIKNAFKKVIRVPYGGYPKMCKKWGVPYPCGWHTVYFSFTIEQILNGVKGVIAPVKLLLDKAMDVVLSPLLKALNLNIKLPSIPDLDILDNLINNLESAFDSIITPLNKLMEYLDTINKFIDVINSYIDQFNKINKACLIEFNE
jgi:hypothetical protein